MQLKKCKNLFFIISLVIKTGGTRRASTLANVLEPQLKAIEEAGTWKNERIISSAQDTEIILSNGSKVLNFCANNYLGLSVNFLHN